MTANDRRIPVGIVSKNYSLVQHLALGELCLAGMVEAKVDVSQVRCEVGLYELGEWMNLRLYFPHSYAFVPNDGETLDLRVEAFNSVDGSSRLVLLLGWYRMVCSNGLVIGRSLVEIRGIHSPSIDLSKVKRAIANGTRMAKKDCERLSIWQNRQVDASRYESWIDGAVSDRWGKKAACRVFHICTSGNDITLARPFSPERASQKPIRIVRRVPGAQVPAATLYDVSQALSWVATQRNDAEERIKWQIAIPGLIKRLAA